METTKEIDNREHIYWNIRRGYQFGTVAEAHIYGLSNARRRLEIIEKWKVNKDWCLYLVAENGQEPVDFDE